MSKYQIKYSSTTQSLLALRNCISDIINVGKISDTDILTLRYWMDDNKHLVGNYPFDKIYSLIDEILSDGVIDSEEKEHLLKILSNEAIYEPASTSIEFLFGCHVCLTGNFTFSSRKEIEETIEKYGGFNEHKSPTRQTDYLFVGGKGSPDWAYGNYGNKIKKAKELQEYGYSILIMSEDALKNFFSSHDLNNIYSMQECIQLFESLNKESMQIIQNQINATATGCVKVVQPLSHHLDSLVDKGILFECTANFNWFEMLSYCTRDELNLRIESLNTGLRFRKNLTLESLIKWCATNIPERARELFPEYGAFMLNEKFFNYNLLSQLQDFLN